MFACFPLTQPPSHPHTYKENLAVYLHFRRALRGQLKSSGELAALAELATSRTSSGRASATRLSHSGAGDTSELEADTRMRLIAAASTTASGWAYVGSNSTI